MFHSVKGVGRAQTVRAERTDCRVRARSAHASEVKTPRFAQKRVSQNAARGGISTATQEGMVPISPRKQVAGVIGAMALGYALSWAFTPGPGTGPVEKFEPTFGQSVAPVIVSPDQTPSRRRTVENPQKFDRKPLQDDRAEPI